MYAKLACRGLAVLLLLTTAPAAKAQHPTLAGDSLALVDFYHALNGPNWTQNFGWLTGPVYGWWGVSVSAEGRVYRLLLPGHNLDGTLPASIGNLDALKYLILWGNSITGPIPPEIGNLAILEQLELHRNQLSGEIPVELGTLESVVTIRLSDNELSGLIPTPAGDFGFSNLEILSVEGNQLSGSIPAQILFIPTLRTLRASSNNLTGQIPAEIGELAELEVLDLSGNQLTGPLPSTLYGLSKLTGLWLGNNPLETTISPAIGNLTRLETLDIGSAQLKGSIPPEIRSLMNLTNLHLPFNELHGDVPIESLPNLKNVDVQSNQLEVLPNLEALTQLESLRIQNNRFTFGDIVPNVGLAQFVYEYRPQAPVGEFNEILTALGGRVELIVQVGHFSGNQYRWAIYGEIIDGATGPSHTIASVSDADVGLYTVRITHPAAPDLTLLVEPIELLFGDPLEEGFHVTVLGLVGEVEVIRAGDAIPILLRGGERLLNGDRIYTGFESTIDLLFKDGSTVSVKELTDLKIAQFDGLGSSVQTRLWLKSGQVAAAVKKKAAVRSNFNVKAPSSGGSVRGTTFSVKADSLTLSATFAVEEGTLDVVPDNPDLGPVTLTEGQQVTVTPTSISPVITEVLITVDGDTLAIGAVTDTLDFGDVDVASSGGKRGGSGVTAEKQLRITNLNTKEILFFGAETLLDVPQPETAVAEAATDTVSGFIDPDSTAVIVLSVGNASEPGIFDGTLRLRFRNGGDFTIAIPLRFSAGEAEAPVVWIDDVALQDLGDLGDSVISRTFALSNQGNLDLVYAILSSFSTRDFAFGEERQRFSPEPIPGVPAGSILNRYFVPSVVDNAEILFEADFEIDAAGFVAEGVFAQDWSRTAAGAAALDGHSGTTAMYFGMLDSLRYRNDIDERLVSPMLDLSNTKPEDLVVLSFSYFLSAEADYDIASVLVSTDAGQTFDELGTSDRGLLRTDSTWQSILLTLPDLSGNTQGVRIAFRFTSDRVVPGEGWYIDDVQLSILTAANPVYTSPREGFITGTGESEITVYVNPAPLVEGFYEAQLQVITNDRNQPSTQVPLSFTVDTPSPPALVPEVNTFTAIVAPGDSAPKELSILNTGSVPLSLVRVVEPALSDLGLQTARDLLGNTAASALDVPQDADMAARKSERAAHMNVLSSQHRLVRDSLFSIILPGADLAHAIAQLPDGRLLVTDATREGGQTYVLSATLDLLGTVSAVLPGVQTVGLAYNSSEESVWMAGLLTKDVVEAKMNGDQLQLTGRGFELDFSPVNMTYSDVLDAFFVVEAGHTRVWAVDIEGRVLPGYPVHYPLPSVQSLSPGITASGGVLEIGVSDLGLTDGLTYQQLDQFARPYAESAVVEIPISLVPGAARISGLLRSRIDPNGVFYYLAYPDSVDGNVRIVAVDPPDLADNVFSFTRLAGSVLAPDLAPGEARVLPFEFEAEDRPEGTYSETLAFLTNNPDTPVVRVPVEMTVTTTVNTDDGSELPQDYALHANYPNPFNPETTIRFALPAASLVTINIYDVLGRKVVTLIDEEEMRAGIHVAHFSGADLASGAYILRLNAGTFTATRKVTLVR